MPNNTRPAWNEHEITLPWTKPPLSLNGREHWRARARKTRTVRTQTAWIVRARENKHPPLAEGERLRVELHYLPRDNRRRDTDNLVALLKPICDGLVDSGIVPDDTPTYMVKPEPTIHPHANGQQPRIWIKLTVLSPNGLTSRTRGKGGQGG